MKESRERGEIDLLGLVKAGVGAYKQYQFMEGQKQKAKSYYEDLANAFKETVGIQEEPLAWEKKPQRGLTGMPMGIMDGSGGSSFMDSKPGNYTLPTFEMKGAETIFISNQANGGNYENLSNEIQGIIDPMSIAMDSGSGGAVDLSNQIIVAGKGDQDIFSVMEKWMADNGIKPGDDYAYYSQKFLEANDIQGGEKNYEQQKVKEGQIITIPKFEESGEEEDDDDSVTPQVTVQITQQQATPKLDEASNNNKLTDTEVKQKVNAAMPLSTTADKIVGSIYDFVFGGLPGIEKTVNQSDSIALKMADAIEKLNGMPYYRPDGTPGAGHFGNDPFTIINGKYEGADCGAGVIYGAKEAGGNIRRNGETVSEIMPFFDMVHSWADASNLSAQDYYNEFDNLVEEGKIKRGYVFFYQRNQADENEPWDHAATYLGIDEDGKYGFKGQHIMLNASSRGERRNRIVPIDWTFNSDKITARKNGVPYRVRIGKPNELFFSTINN